MTIDNAEVYRDSNKATIDYAKNAIQFVFLLNVAAATALFAKSGTEFIVAAILFALGAGMATICMGATYITQFLITETWRQGDPVRLELFGTVREYPLVRIEAIRTFTMILWVAAMLLFACGIGGALAAI